MKIFASNEYTPVPQYPLTFRLSVLLYHFPPVLALRQKLRNEVSISYQLKIAFNYFNFGSPVLADLRYS